jgi:hypothetical protein
MKTTLGRQIISSTYLLRKMKSGSTCDAVTNLVPSYCVVSVVNISHNVRNSYIKGKSMDFA